jgi:hypothetical protein
MTDPRDEVKAHVLSHYVRGAFNERNLDAMRAGFDESFAIFSADGDALDRFTLETWLSKLQDSLDNGYDPNAAKNVWKHEFAHVDVTDGGAMVKLDLFNEGTHIYTDYITLLRFDSGWRIVAKIYVQHNERVNW